jgi:hypothetical protein
VGVAKGEMTGVAVDAVPVPSSTEYRPGTAGMFVDSLELNVVAAVGVKLTWNWQNAPGASVAGQLLVSEKPELGCSSETPSYAKL